MSSSERSASASRRTLWAARWSSQNPGALVSASSWATRSALASRSKAPRGRLDPFGQVADGGRVHLVPALEILEQDGAQLDEPQRRLAPSDDGVHAWTVAVVRADPAVAVTIERRGVTARSAVPLAGDQIDERGVLGLLHGLPLTTTLGTGRGAGSDSRMGLGRPPSTGLAQYTRPIPQRQEGNRAGRPGDRARTDVVPTGSRRSGSRSPGRRARARRRPPARSCRARAGSSASANPRR